jgi:hypothetical protein
MQNSSAAMNAARLAPRPTSSATTSAAGTGHTTRPYSTASVGPQAPLSTAKLKGVDKLYPTSPLSRSVRNLPLGLRLLRVHRRRLRQARAQPVQLHQARALLPALQKHPPGRDPWAVVEGTFRANGHLLQPCTSSDRRQKDGRIAGALFGRAVDGPRRMLKLGLWLLSSPARPKPGRRIVIAVEDDSASGSESSDDEPLASVVSRLWSREASYALN